METYLKFNGKMDRRSPRDEGDGVYLRENFLARDGILTRPKGTDRYIDNTFTDRPTWIARYHSIESGIVSPKTFAYSVDGKLWRINDDTKQASEIKTDLNEDAYPKHWLFKVGTQTIMYFVDGLDLYKHDGNNDDIFDKVDVTDTDGNSIEPIDIIEHKDRSILISKSYVYVSKNLAFDVFNDSTDSIQIIVGSGKGENLALGKIEDRLYIFNTEGIFVLEGDVISAQAATFEVRLVDERRIIAGRTATKVEKAIMFLADDLEVWSWDGNTTTKMSHYVKLEDSINPYRDMLNKAIATFEDGYYKLSFVENQRSENNLEWWWDSYENRDDFVRSRNVACYMKTDPTVELERFFFVRSDVNYMMESEIGFTFDGTAITTKLWTRDYVLMKNHNVRILSFFPNLPPVGPTSIIIAYLLDGRLSGLDANARWTQSLQGETTSVGEINLNNQSQTTDRIRPKINYSRGESIAFYIEDSTLNTEFKLKGMGIEFIDKGLTKGRTVGK